LLALRYDINCICYYTIVDAKQYVVPKHLLTYFTNHLAISEWLTWNKHKWPKTKIVRILHFLRIDFNGLDLAISTSGYMDEWHPRVAYPITQVLGGVLTHKSEVSSAVLYSKHHRKALHVLPKSPDRGDTCMWCIIQGNEEELSNPHTKYWTI